MFEYLTNSLILTDVLALLPFLLSSYSVTISRFLLSVEHFCITFFGVATFVCFNFAGGANFGVIFAFSDPPMFPLCALPRFFVCF
jgi:hypothetical protein